MKSKLLLLFLMALVGISSVGCSGGGGGGESPQASIAGSICNEYAGYIEGVKVDVGGKAAAVSDKDGYFATTRFPLGTYTITFAKEGYWTYSFQATFDKAGDFRFKDPIFLSKVASGTGNIIEPTFIKDVTNNSQWIIKADNRLKSIIGIVCRSSSSNYSNNVNVRINTDTGSGVALSQNENRVNGYPRTAPEPYQRLREYDRKLIQNMMSRNMRPGMAANKLNMDLIAEQVSFYKYSFDDNNSFTSVNANLKYNGTKCLIYLDSAQTIPDSYLKQVGETFDGFYKNMVDNFGEVTVDIDGTDKICLLLTELPSSESGAVLGYFSAVNEFPKYAQPYSNQREMLYLTTKTNANLDAWLTEIKATAAHEFQHLINYSSRKGRDHQASATWINEGLSMVAQDIAIAGPGQHNPNLDPTIQQYLKYHKYDCLTEWQGNGLDYATAYMFMRYIADRFGESVLKKINSYDQGYPDVFKGITGEDFWELFKDWLTAVMLDSIGFTNQDSTITRKYTYSTLDLSKFEFPKSGSGYIDLSSYAGDFIYLPNIEAAKRVDVTIDGSYDKGLRLVMLSSGGAILSKAKTPEMIQIGK